MSSHPHAASRWNRASGGTFIKLLSCVLMTPFVSITCRASFRLEKSSNVRVSSTDQTVKLSCKNITKGSVCVQHRPGDDKTMSHLDLPFGCKCEIVLNVSCLSELTLAGSAGASACSWKLRMRLT